MAIRSAEPATVTPGHNVSGGDWSNAGDWTDTTAGATATAAPGASDAVTIADNTGAWTPQIIFGPGQAASQHHRRRRYDPDLDHRHFRAVLGRPVRSRFGRRGAVQRREPDAGSLSVTSLLRVAGASPLTVIGSGNGTFISGDLSVGTDSAVRVEGGASVISGTVAVDGTSSVEFGTAGTATSGSFAIDYGQSVTLQGVATIAAAKLALGGSLLVYSGTIEGFGGSTGAITGNGTITIGALGSSGSLVLSASDTAAIDFLPYAVLGPTGVTSFFAFETLELKTLLQVGVISGFLAGDSIIIDRNVTGVAFTQTSASQGILTLTDGATTVGTLTFAGNYAGLLFQVDVAPETGVATISLQTVGRRRRHRGRQHQRRRLQLDRRQRCQLVQRGQSARHDREHHARHSARKRQRRDHRRQYRRRPTPRSAATARPGPDGHRQCAADRPGRRRRPSCLHRYRPRRRADACRPGRR